jgi:hypothetical protein
MNHWRTSAPPPATIGVEWLVPDDDVYHCWLGG